MVMQTGVALSLRCSWLVTSCSAATTLCAAHYLACSASIYATQTMGYVKKVSLPAAGALWCLAPSHVSSRAQRFTRERRR